MDKLNNYIKKDMDPELKETIRDLWEHSKCEPNMEFLTFVELFTGHTLQEIIEIE